MVPPGESGAWILSLTGGGRDSDWGWPVPGYPSDEGKPPEEGENGDVWDCREFNVEKPPVPVSALIPAIGRAVESPALFE